MTLRLRARHRRRIHLTVAILWLGPGAALSIAYPDSLAWIVFMSWFACVYAAVSAWAAETPVEDERTEARWELRIAGGVNARQLLKEGWEPIGSYLNPVPPATHGEFPAEPLLTTFRKRRVDEPVAA